jgi:hypothetical protein
MSPKIDAMEKIGFHMKKSSGVEQEAVQKTEVVFSRQLPCLAVFCNDMVKKMQLIA